MHTSCLFLLWLYEIRKRIITTIPTLHITKYCIDKNDLGQDYTVQVLNALMELVGKVN